MLKQKHLLFFLLFTTFVSLIIIVWSMNKGFNLSDEGFYITGYNNLIEFPFWLSAFHYLTNNTLSYIGSGIIFFRLARLLLTIAGSVFLSYTLFGLLKKFNFVKKANEKTTLIALSLFGIIGTFAGYGLGPQALSYNHYTLIFGDLFLGLIFLAFTNSQNIKKNLFISGALGIISGLEFFVKIPTTLLLSVLFICVQVLLFKQIRWFSFLNIMVYSFFAILSFSLISFPSSPIQVLNEYTYVITFISKFYTHDINYVLYNYKMGFLDFWSCHLVNYVPGLFYLIIAFVISIQNRFTRIKPIGRFLLLFLILSMVYSFYKQGYFLSGSKHNSTAPLIYIALLFLFSLLYIFTKTKAIIHTDFFLEKAFVVLSLLFLPFICALGTGNFLHVQILFFLNTWFLFIYLIYTFSGLEKFNFNISISILLITLTVKSTFDVFTGLVVDPYKINGHLWEQTEPLKIQSTNETIFIDKELMNTIKTLHPIIESENPDALFTSSQLIGLSYIFNKKLIGYAWYDSGISPKEFFVQSYNKSTLKEKNKICFMLLSAENNYKIVDHLSDKKTNTQLITLPWENDSIFIYSRHN